MADLIGEGQDIISGAIPKLKGFGTGLLGWGAWAILFIILVSVAVFAIWFILRLLKYNKKIEVFEKIGGRFEKTRVDRAMEVKFSTAGDTIFYLRKHRKYLPNPTIQAGRRLYWYFIDPVDNEWINFGPGDFHEDRKRLGGHILHTDMRYARTQVQKGLKERYEKPGFWKQYGLLVFSIAFIALIGVMTFLLFDKWIEGLGAVPDILEKLGVVLDRADAILGKLDNVCQGGSGFR